MAFDDQLAERIRQHLGERRDVTEKKMFGGLAFLVNGNMCCGVHDRELIVSLDPEETGQAEVRFVSARQGMRTSSLTKHDLPAGLGPAGP